MVLSIYKKLCILSLHQRGCRISYIAECLVMEDGIVVSKQGIRKDTMIVELSIENQDRVVQ